MKNRILSALLFLFVLSSADAKVTLPAILTDGMVMQRERPISIWGWAEKGEKVSITFNKKNYSLITPDNGKWKIELPAMKAGGPYTLKVNNIVVEDILIGDVWLCTGQSNMELQVRRVTDKYAKEIAEYENENIRFAKIPYGNDTKGVQQDIARFEMKSDQGDGHEDPKAYKNISSLKWKKMTKGNLEECGALVYFYAKEMYKRKGVPVGIVNSSWGGSTIEAWMSEDALKEFPIKLTERDVYNSDEYRKAAAMQSMMTDRQWSNALYKNDKGMQSEKRWYAADLDDSDWKRVDMFANDWKISNGRMANGSHWFRQNINLTAEQAKKNSVLRVGCIVDADSVYVNGHFVGTVSYQYPPRIYNVPASILKEGSNNVTVRMISYGGMPSFVKDKLYCLAQDGDTINLSHEWRYKSGCNMPSKASSISFQNVPTGMFNSMINPILNLKFKGAMWYQGESNTGQSNEYEALLSSMIGDWRERFNDREMPFVVVQLPNFMQYHKNPVESGWAGLREAQRQVTLKLPMTALAVAIDLGEWNDIHPLNKKDLAFRIAQQMEKMAYKNSKVISDGPICEKAVLTDGKIEISFKEGTDKLVQEKDLKGFAVQTDKTPYRWVKASTAGNKVILDGEFKGKVLKVRYGWDDNPEDISLKNEAGLPASPFQIEVQ